MTDGKTDVEVEIFIQILFHVKKTTECFEPTVVVSSEPTLSTIQGWCQRGCSGRVSEKSSIDAPTVLKESKIFSNLKNAPKI